MNRRTVAAYALGPVGSAALGLLTLPLLSWYFPAQDIGRTALLQTAVSLLLIVAGMGADQAYIREFHAAPDRNLLLKNVLLPPLAALTFILLLWAALPFSAAQLLFGSRNPAWELWIALYAAAWLFTRYLSLILRLHERALAFSAAQVWPKLCLLLSAPAAVAAGAPADTGTLAAAFALSQSAAVLLLAWQTRIQLAAALRAPFSRTLLGSLLHYGLPLALAALAYWGLGSADKWLLKQYAAPDILGVYALAAGFAAAAVLVQSIFSTIWAPTLFRWVHEQRDLAPVARIFRLLTGAAAAVWCLSALAAPLTRLFLPTDYAAVPFLLPLVMLPPLIYTLTEVGGIGIQVRKKSRAALWITLASLCAHLALGRLLIPAFGAAGAALAVSLAFALFFVLKTEYARRIWLPLPRAAAYAAVAAALLLGSAYAAYGAAYPAAFALLWTVLSVALAVSFRRDLAAALTAGRLKTATEPPDGKP
ncbi:oligosaccharide flippase family protein [Neisseria leonii]|uniref:Oligosaccharide flippase family protein n=1 Tax=Neisseria leonii TaxID=2995413 RepID=A0A9X4E5P9_9NEIS|nr:MULTISPECIES: oligosaccharide flippase family protein [unclassified Neisseria]MDD9326608.1 oligosaccharide flippase family protein [Neisseria sp. 3986]MDD9328366.1 oligosaccharide flippase family protein [Neisseria sp. 51.81]